MATLVNLLLFCFIRLSFAQYPPLSNLTTITSPYDGNIQISYQPPPNDTCTTAFATQQQYTGWVKITGEYPKNIFFWFFGARTPTQQLTIWLNGGPGSSSLIGLFQENGPCEAYEVAENEFATRARDFGWDRGSNMLYIDQPNQVGFSYDVPTNGSLDLLTSTLYPPTLSNATSWNGTFGSLNVNNTANTTQTAAVAVWHMLQGFLGAFPQYLPPSSVNSTSSVGVNLFVESYGGKFGPAFASFFEDQNARRLNGTISKSNTLPISLASLGIINGCVDDAIQAPFYPIMANQNSYGLSAMNPTMAELANASFYAAGGCKELIARCRAAVLLSDPNDDGVNTTVDSTCNDAYDYCYKNVVSSYMQAGRSIYDIGHLEPDPFPPRTFLEYLNTASVQEAIGAPINFTQTSFLVAKAFQATGDYERDSLVPKLAGLLSSGIRVGLIYGDRDYICNWYGGEAISLAVAAAASTSYSTNFPAAGYAPIIVNSSYIGGVVRQYGNLSFSRIYDAGHAVPAYQPETAFQVFARIIGGTSIGTGLVADLTTFNSSGPASASHTNTLPDSPSPTCWIRDLPNTCTNEQRKIFKEGKGAIINGILYSRSSDFTLMTKATTALEDSVTTATVTTVSTATMTGLFTATSTPKGVGAVMGVSLRLVAMSLALIGCALMG